MNRIFSRLITAIFIISLVGGAPASTANADPTTPDFGITASPTNVTIPLAGSGAGTGSFSVAIQSFLGFADPIELTASVSPATGLAVSPTSTTVTPTGTTYLSTTFSLLSPLAPSSTGTYTVTIVGKDPGPPIRTRIATVKVDVVAPDFSIVANPTSISFAQVGGAGTFSVPVTGVGGFSSNVTVTPAATPELTFTPASQTVPAGSAASFSVTASTAAAAVGTHSVTITGSCTACSLIGGDLSHTTPISIMVRPPDFSLSSNVNTVIFTWEGGSGSFNINVNPIDNFTGVVDLTYSSSPAGLTVTPPSPASSGPPYAAKTFGLSSTSPNVYQVTITGTGTSTTGTLVRTKTITVIVPANTGFRNPTAQTSSDSDGDGNGFQTNPANAFMDDGLFAVDTDSGQGTDPGCAADNKDSHRFYNYGFAIPAGAMITGIEVRLDAKVDAAAGSPTMCAQLSWGAGADGTYTAFAPSKTTPTLTNGELIYRLPAASAASDTWGRTWTTGDLTNTNFRLKITNVSTVETTDFSLDWAAVKVHYSAINTTSTVITSHTPNPSVVGEPVIVAYTVTPFTGSGTPTGNVTVSDGNGISCTATVAAGSCSLTFTTPGTKNLIATYAGGGGFSASTSAGASHTVNPGPTTTTITSDTPDPSVVGGPVSVSFTVVAAAPGAGTPTGNVTVSDGVDSCTGTVATGNCSLNLTTAGARTLTANYAGDTKFSGSASAGEPHLVNTTSLSIVINSDLPDPSAVGQPVTVSYTVTGGTTGSVTVSDGINSCSAPYTGPTGSCTLTLTTAGARTLTATYNGPSTATSPGEPHTVNAADATTTTITLVNPTPSVVGQPVTINYTVTSAGGTPTGNVTVSDGTQSCTDTVAAGGCSITFTSAGARTLTATYAGGGTFSGSTSATAAHTVNKANTITTIASHTPEQPPDSPDPSVVGQQVIVQYDVAAAFPGSGAPTGNVTVTDGVISCTASVAAGSCTLTFTSAGPRTLTASYAGNANFNTSTSAGEPHTVNKADVNATITSDTPDPSVVSTAVTVNYTIVAAAPGAGTPTGNVTVSDGVDSCTASVAAGTCSLILTTTGLKSLTVSYPGDANFNPQVSPTVSHQVNAGVVPGAFNKTSPANNATGQSLSPTLSWAASSGATAYEYCIATTAAGCTTWVSVSTNQSVTLSGLSASTAYFWHVRATNSFGTTYSNGNATARWTFTTGTGVVPGAFGKTAPANGATGVVARPTLTWAASSGATSYEYCISTTAAGCTTWVNRGTNLNAPLTSTDLNPNTTYFWHVRAVNGTGTTYSNGNATARWSFTTGTTPASFNKTSPANAATGQSRSPTLSWGASTGATTYQYCIALTATSCTTWVSVSTNQSVTLSGLAANTAYFWHVRATNSFGTTYSNGSNTARWTFTTGP